MESKQITLPAGTVVHIGGMPVELTEAVAVRTSNSEWVRQYLTPHSGTDGGTR
jgi:hypothetical protein